MGNDCGDLAWSPQREDQVQEQGTNGTDKEFLSLVNCGPKQRRGVQLGRRRKERGKYLRRLLQVERALCPL